MSELCVGHLPPQLKDLLLRGPKAHRASLNPVAAEIKVSHRLLYIEYILFNH